MALANVLSIVGLNSAPRFTRPDWRDEHRNAIAMFSTRISKYFVIRLLRALSNTRNGFSCKSRRTMLRRECRSRLITK